MSSKQVPVAAASGTKEKELLFFQTILLNMKNKPEVDWDAVASLTGYNKGSTASTRFYQLIRAAKANNPNLKTATDSGSASASGSGTNTTPSKVTKARTPRKPKAAGVGPKRRAVSKASELKRTDKVQAEEGDTGKEEAEEEDEEEDTGVYHEAEEEME